MAIAQHDLAQTLPEDLCRMHLAKCRHARVAVTVGALPAIFPVDYVLVDDEIAFALPHASNLRTAVENAIVAFEVDDASDHHRASWSVLAVGRAVRVVDLHLARRAMAVGLALRADDPDSLILFRADLVSGQLEFSG